MAANLETMNVMSDVAVANSTEDHKKISTPQPKRIEIRKWRFKNDAVLLRLSDADDKKVLRSFKSKIGSENKIRKKRSLPIAKYDVSKGKAYLLYPDGEKKYYDPNA